VSTSTKYSSAGQFVVNDLACSRNNNTLFESLNLSLGAGQVLLLEGENGSGKTSLLRIICGYRQQDHGGLYWDGQPVSEVVDYPEKIAYVGHKNGVKDELTVEENLQSMNAMMSSSKMRLESVLQDIGLFKYSDVLTKQLSAGQKRKLALSKLLFIERPFWILDEPFTSLDVASVKFFEMEIKKHIQRGGMLILTSHHEVNLDGLNVNRFELSS
jgi:heme exporter protein A